MKSNLFALAILALFVFGSCMAMKMFWQLNIFLSSGISFRL